MLFINTMVNLSLLGKNLFAFICVKTVLLKLEIYVFIIIVHFMSICLILQNNKFVIINYLKNTKKRLYGAAAGKYLTSQLLALARPGTESATSFRL